MNAARSDGVGVFTMLLVAAVALLGVLASEGARAAPERMTLADAVASGLDRNSGARIARLETDAAENAVGETRAPYLPQVSVATFAGYSNRFDEKLRAVDGDGVERKYGLATIAADEGWFNVYVDQLLFDLSQVRLIEREELAAEAARLAERHEREEAAYEITRSYAELVRLERLVEATDRLAADAEWLHNQARVLSEAGRALSLEREQVALYLDEARLEARSTRDRVAAGRAALADAIGRGESEGAAPEVVPESLPQLTPEHLEEPAEAAIEDAPDLQVLALRRRMEEASVASARALRLPKVRLRGGYSHYGIKRFDNFPDETFVGVAMDVPVFDGLRSRNAVQGARRSEEIAGLRYRTALKQRRRELRELFARLAERSERSMLAERWANAARERQRLADLRLRADRGSVGDALAARQDAARRVREAIDSRFDAVDMWAILHARTGSLTRVVTGEAVGEAAD
jgi:outer membrane protein TolC